MYRADGPVEEQVAGRDRVRDRRGGDERERPPRPDTRLRGRSSAWSTFDGAPRSTPLLGSTSPLPADASGASATAPPGMPRPTSRANLVMKPPPGPARTSGLRGGRQPCAQGLPLDAWAWCTPSSRHVDLAREGRARADARARPCAAGRWASVPMPTASTPRSIATWNQRMMELPALPNVRVKLGGLTMHT
jgi:hypothetical protein